MEERQGLTWKIAGHYMEDRQGIYMEDRQGLNMEDRQGITWKIGRHLHGR